MFLFLLLLDTAAAATQCHKLPESLAYDRPLVWEHRTEQETVKNNWREYYGPWSIAGKTGVYSLRVTDAANCKAVKNYTVYGPPPRVISYTNPTQNCASDTQTSFSLTITGGHIAYWEPLDVQPAAEVYRPETEARPKRVFLPEETVKLMQELKQKGMPIWRIAHYFDLTEEGTIFLLQDVGEDP